MDRAKFQSAIQSKDAARVNREANKLNDALRDIGAATGQLQETLESARAQGDDDSSPSFRELIGALAESYGVQGGIYRSLNKPEEAVIAYDRGYVFEKLFASSKENSYNLVQRLISRIFAAPSAYGRTTWLYEDHDMWMELAEARDEVRRQMDEGGRGGDPWAAADAMLLDVLLAPRLGVESAGRQIMESLERFEDLEYDPFVCASTIRAFTELKQKLAGAAPYPGAEGRALTIRYLQMAIARIKEFSEQSGG